MKRVLIPFLLLLLGLAEGQVVRPFATRYQTNTNGDIVLIGNTLMTCSPTGTNGASCANARNGAGSLLNNNSFTMVYVDADSDPTTFNSSSADLSLPAGATVLWAGLYWGAEAPSLPNPNTVLFRTPASASYVSLTATQTDSVTVGTNRVRYQGFVEVTTLVQTAGSGTYWVANVTGSPNGSDRYAGWSLVVVYQHSGEPLRHLHVYDGYASVGGTSSVTITVTGFLTPATGTVTTRLGAVAYEGDRGIPGDRLQVNGVDVSDALNPDNNFFNSTISDLGSHVSSKNPNYINQLGFDIDRVQSTSLLGNNQTSANISFVTTGDAYFPGVLTFAVNVFLPDLATTFTKTVQDLNGGDVLPGDVLEYTLSFSNTGLDGATNVVLRDPIPTHTQYVPGSLQVLTNATGAPTGTFTDAAGDDIAEYAPSCPEFSGAPCVRFRLGTGANATSGGLIPPGQGASVRFRVQVLPSAAGQTITNTAQVSYNSQTLGTGYSQAASASVQTPVLGYTLSGQVYHDREPNGMRNGEDWSDGATVYVKLVQGSTVVAVETVSPGSGTYTFTGVAPGTYTLVLDDNNSPADTTPTPPSGWLFINPALGSRSVTVSGADVTGQDFGLFRGFRLEGRVFLDDGEGGGNANNAWQDGAERGVPGVVVTATDGTNSRTATTDGLGFYRLYVPYSFGSVTLSHPARPATGWNDETTAYQVASWAEATSGVTVNLGLASALSGVVVRNFGVVRESRLYPDASGQTSSPGAISYAHFIKPGTLGNYTLSLANAPRFAYQVRRDVNCDGDFDDPGEGFQGLTLTFTVDATWPREADGSLKACGLEVRVLVPAGEPDGSLDIALLSGALRYANNPGVVETRSLTDTTTVSTGQVRLEKRVRNVTQGTAFGTSASGKPGEVLEYCIAFRNLGTAAVTDFVLTDPIPFFTDLWPYGPSQDVKLTFGTTTYLTAASDSDQGEVVGGVVRVALGTLGPGAYGEVCYQARIR